MSDKLLTRAYYGWVMHDITLGSKCKLAALYNEDTSSFDDYPNFDGNEAVVVKLNERTVDLRIETGPRKGKIIEKVNPGSLFFPGTFQKVEPVEEGTHF